MTADQAIQAVREENGEIALEVLSNEGIEIVLGEAHGERTFVVTDLDGEIEVEDMTGIEG